MAKKKTNTKKTAKKPVKKAKAATKKPAKPTGPAKKTSSSQAPSKKTAGKTTKKKVAKKTVVKKTAEKAAAVSSRPKTPKTAKKSPAKTTKKKPAATPGPKASRGTQAASNGDAKPASKPPAKRFRYVPPEAEAASVEVVELTPADLKKVKSGLTKREVLRFKQLLLEKRAELLGDVESMELARDAARGGDASHMPLHMADVGSDNFEQEFMLGLMEADRKLLVEIDEALRRVIDGYYGVCLDRGVPIGKPRLEAKPWAKYCIEAVREREKRGQY